MPIVLSADSRTSGDFNDWTVTPSVSPVGHEIVLAVSFGTNTGALVGISGCGASWSKVTDAGLAQYNTELWIGTGATSHGVISVDANGAVYNDALVLVADLTSTTVVVDKLQTAAASLTGPSQSAGPGQLVICTAYDRDTLVAWGTTTPASGWSEITGRADRYEFSYREPAATETHQRAATATAGSNPLTVVQFVIGDVAGPTIPERASSATVTVGAGSSATAVHQAVSGATVAASAGSSAQLVGEPEVRASGATVTATGGSKASLVTTGGDGQSLVGGFAFGSELTSSLTSVQRGLEGGFAFGSRLTQTRDWGIDPRSTRPSPSVVIAQRDGTPVTSLDHVAIGQLESGVGVVDSWRFSVDRDDAHGKLIEPVAHEALLYRGTYLMSKGPIGPGRLEGGRMVYDVADPRWYLYGHRRIGRYPALNWAYNGDFTKGTAGWTGAFKTGSVPEAKPVFYVVDEPEATSGKGLRIEGVDKVVTTRKDVETAAVFVANEATYLPGGEAILIAAADDIPDGTDIHIVGHTADRRAYGDPGDGLELSLARAQAARASLAAHNSTWTFSLPPDWFDIDPAKRDEDATVGGRGRYDQIASNATETESAKNRRVALHYASTQTATGHRQYVAQRRYNVVQEVDMLVPLKVIVVGRMRIGEWLGAPADGNAMRVVLVDLETGEQARDADGQPVEATATMNEATPRLRFHEYEVSVDVPPDGRTYYLSYELYPPAGWGVWFDVEVLPQEQRGYFDMDQALIVRDLTLHVQDTHYGHGDLGIGTRTPLTGVTRTREYPFRERKPYGTAIEELTALAKGVEVDCEVTATSATIVTHFPRQGGVSGLTLAHGGRKSIVKAYRPIAAESRLLASNIIMQAWGYTSTRSERNARDETAFGGALLEAVIEAEGESPPSELAELAAQHLARSIHPRSAWEVFIDSARTSEVLDEVGKGDSVFLSLPDEGVHSLHRMVLMTWDPETDALVLQLAPEEV